LNGDTLINKQAQEEYATQQNAVNQKIASQEGKIAKQSHNMEDKLNEQRDQQKRGLIRRTIVNAFGNIGGKDRHEE